MEQGAVLDDLLRRGFALASPTNGSEQQQRAKLQRLGLLERVGPVFTAEALGVAKPHPAAFHAVCGRLGIEPAKVLYVGDDVDLDVVCCGARGGATGGSP